MGKGTYFMTWTNEKCLEVQISTDMEQAYGSCASRVCPGRGHNNLHFVRFPRREEVFRALDVIKDLEHKGKVLYIFQDLSLETLQRKKLFVCVLACSVCKSCILFGLSLAL